MQDIKDCNKNVFVGLKSVVNHHEIFVDRVECLSYATAIRDEKLFFIISSFFGKTYVQSIDELPQTESIYIFSSVNKDQDDDWTKSFKKVKSISQDLSSISSQLQTNTRRFINDVPSINILSSTPGENTSSEAVLLMYVKIINDILYNFVPTEQSKEEMINFFKQVYSDNETQRGYIDDFYKTYNSEQAILWYTKNTFLYRVLNKAYRVLDTDALFKMRYYIADLFKQFWDYYPSFDSSTSMDLEETLTVYRGYGISISQFEKLKMNIKGTIFFTDFLSTSKDRDIAFGFAVSHTTVSDHVAILLHMNVRIDQCGVIMADAQTCSQFRSEQEILFQSGTAFRLISIDSDVSGVWNVHLEYDSENDQGIARLFHHLRLHITHTTNDLTNWAGCMVEMGYYDQAERYFLLALEDPEVKEDMFLLAQTHNDLGFVYKRKKDYEKALQHYETAIKSLKTRPPPEYKDTENLLVSILIRIGISYSDQNNYEKALEYFNQAILFEEKETDPIETNIALCYCYIGEVFWKQKCYSKALELCEKARKIQLQFLPSNHPNIAIVYNIMSQIYSSRKDYVNAINYMKQTLAIQQDFMLPTHPLLAETYSNLSKVLYEQHQYQEALQYIKLAYDIHQNSFPFDHPDVTATKQWIAELEMLIDANSDLTNTSIH
ncbi:unnamed protein product [Adineta steineri]|uniref:Uncharacterized protein n=1 Tax=Adineta steineri TaxID=433720 RepID=A0A819A5H4_9BILA|nr:unnamed protein product [Adineta steineri]CAF3778733.1 unnamed protein product [Adineta steineri]